MSCRYQGYTWHLAQPCDESHWVTRFALAAALRVRQSIERLRELGFEHIGTDLELHWIRDGNEDRFEWADLILERKGALFSVAVITPAASQILEDVIERSFLSDLSPIHTDASERPNATESAAVCKSTIDSMAVGGN